MAVWIVSADTTVVYEAKGKKPFQCGKATQALLPEVEAWVMCEARPFDEIRTPTGTFVKLGVQPC